MQIGNLNQGHILVFNALPEDVEAARDILERANYKVDVSYPGSCNDVTWSHQPDLILLAVTGNEAERTNASLDDIHDFQFQSAMAQIPVILLVNPGKFNITELLSFYRAADFLLLPLREDDLLMRVKTYLLDRNSPKNGLEKEILEAIVANCEDGIIVVNQLQVPIFCNAKAREILQDNIEPFLFHNPQTPKQQVSESGQILTSQKFEQLLQRVSQGEQFRDLELSWKTCSTPNTPSHQHWVLVSGIPIALQTGGGILLLKDITRQKQAEKDILQNALCDELTGLPNRKVLIDRIAHALEHHKRESDRVLALLFIDLDRFKAINDTLGHRVGNELLQEFSQRIKSDLRAEDTIARIGGDEFAILLENLASHSTLISIVERLCEKISSPFYLQGHEVYIDASIGIALGSAQYGHPEDLLRDADIAMYQAKDCAETHYQIFDSSMHLNVDTDLDLEMALRKAISNRELVLHYQPIVLLRSQEILGFEALVRWNHPQLGLLAPSKFISIAEKTGLIIPLGWWVLKEACRQMKEWQCRYPKAELLAISVNMSSKQFSQKYIVEKIEAILHETELEGKHLKLEITESVLIEHSDSIIDVLKQIQGLGIKLSIDDFGTGYSSLSYLHRFPFDALKIDRSFIEGADTDYEKLEILQSVVHLAWNLGLEVVAEGVETEKNYAQLKALRCESGQGYLFSRPLDVCAAEALISSAFLRIK
jgi:diguanylate cyclase (GGDEF)-like protein